MLVKKLLVPVLAVVVTGSALVGANSIVSAQSVNTPNSGLAQVLAGKFHLNEADVQNAITTYMQQQRANRQQNMSQRQKQRLDKLVSQGKISSGQETAILAKLKTLQDKYKSGSFQGMTQAQRQAAFQQEKKDIADWANTQNPKIDPAYVRPFVMGFRGGWHKPTGTPTPAQ